jgi:hypothetical protein
MMPAMVRTIIFVALIASVSASESLNALVNASARFAVAIVQMPRRNWSQSRPARRRARRKWIDLPTAFSVAGEKQEKAADQETLILLQRFSGNPGVEKARAEFGRAQDVEKRFHHDFDGVEFGNSLCFVKKLVVAVCLRSNRSLLTAVRSDTGPADWIGTSPKHRYFTGFINSS